MGQKRSSRPVNVTSGLPWSTDIIRPARLVRLVPARDSCTAANSSSIRSPRRAALMGKSIYQSDGNMTHVVKSVSLDRSIERCCRCGVDARRTLARTFCRVGHYQRPDIDLPGRLRTSRPDRLSNVLVHSRISLSQLFTVPNDGAGRCNIWCGHRYSCRIHDNRWLLCRPHDLRGGTAMEGCAISSLGDIR